MTPQESHQHSLKTLNHLALLEDYLYGLDNITVMGAGIGLDAVWWATLLNSSGHPYNFNVTAVEIAPTVDIKTAGKMSWKFEDMGSVSLPLQDLIWCHNALHYSLNPIGNLFHWHKLLRHDGLLIIEVPNLLSVNNHNDRNTVDVTISSGIYHVYTMSNLIIQLASAGFDCRSAHFQFDKENGWLRAAVYKTNDEPRIYTSLYELQETKRLPQCLDNILSGIDRFNESNLVLEWIDRSQSFLTL
jgi:SAM-dependent methyltransferase